MFANWFFFICFTPPPPPLSPNPLSASHPEKKDCYFRFGGEKVSFIPWYILRLWKVTVIVVFLNLGIPKGEGIFKKESDRSLPLLFPFSILKI